MSSPLTAEDSCSRLSPHLSFGTISIKNIIKNINNKEQKHSDNISKIGDLKKDQGPLGGVLSAMKIVVLTMLWS